MPTLSQNISQVIEDLDSIKESIIQQRVAVPDGTLTSEYSEKILEIEGSQPPAGTINIAENGEYDVSEFAEADVHVPQHTPSGTLEIDQNGDYDVSEYAQASVSVPEPSGSIEITNNGYKISVKDYEFATVNVPQGVFPSGTINISSNGLVNVKTYEQANINVTDPNFGNLISRSIQNVVIPQACDSIGSHAFASCYQLESVQFHDNVFMIQESAFFDCYNLTEIVCPENLEAIHTEAFKGCSNLSSVNFNNKLNYIGGSAFYGCNYLSYIELPDSLWTLTNGAFHETQWYYDQPDGIVYLGNFAYSYKGDMQEHTALTIDDGILYIADRAFNGYSTLESITLADSVVRIGGFAFEQCRYLMHVDFGNGLTLISDYAFYGCNALTAISLPESLVQIGSYSFSGCTSLSEIILGASVTNIYVGAFRYCSSLTDVYYTGTEEQWQQMQIDEGNEYLTNATIHYNYIKE